MSISYIVMTYTEYEGASMLRSFTDCQKAHLHACRATLNVYYDQKVVVNVDNEGEPVCQLTYVNGGYAAFWEQREVS